MSAPRLTRPLVLEAAVRRADGSGGYVERWEPLGTLWAAVAVRSGGEVAGAGVSLSRVGYRITVRAARQGAPSRPVAGQRFRHGVRIFDILAVTERDAAMKYLVCFAEEQRSA